MSPRQELHLFSSRFVVLRSSSLRRCPGSGNKRGKIHKHMMLFQRDPDRELKDFPSAVARKANFMHYSVERKKQEKICKVPPQAVAKETSISVSLHSAYLLKSGLRTK